MGAISQTGLRGIQTGLQQLDLAANKIARSNEKSTAGSVQPASLADDLIDVQSARTQTAASARVIAAEGNILGSLFDAFS